MKNLEHSILVAYDFTEIAMNAVSHAVFFSKILNTGLTLLHIVKKHTEASEMEEQLANEAKKINEMFDVMPNILVREGTIFKTINDISHEFNCMMVVMGTHGMKGLQKITGSWALKVIIGSKVPFLVVQAPPRQGVDMKKVVFPVDFKTENKEKLKWAQFMSKYFGSKIYLFSATSKDGMVEARTKANLVFSKSFLEEKNISYELVLSPDTASFSQEIIDFTETNNADLVIITTTRDIAFHDYILAAKEQYLIANSAKIPVLVINPRTDLMRYGYGNFG
jgi:nucleotide-binding universal stress UspA family protein